MIEVGYYYNDTQAKENCGKGPFADILGKTQNWIKTHSAEGNSQLKQFNAKVASQVQNYGLTLAGKGLRVF